LAYKLFYKSSVEKDLKKLDKSNVAVILSRIETTLSENPYFGSRLIGYSPFSYRLRIGVYRIIYTIEEDTRTVFIHKIGHRKEIYR
jgi:mRNA interferase RelE/StbE